MLAFGDCTVASETCEELFTPAAQNIHLALAGVDIITNGSGSHHQVLISELVLCWMELVSQSITYLSGKNT